MSIQFCLKVVFSTVVIILASNFILTKFVLNFKRDLTDIALNEQSNITTVRKQNETAHYRNFLVPVGFPLTTGLGLSLGYRIRNGNFMDVWKAIMDVSIVKNNFIKFDNTKDKKYSLSEINGMAHHIIENVYKKNDVQQVGINISASSIEGFVLSVASMIHSVRETNSKGLLHYLASVPRQKMDEVDILVIDSWQAYRMLNNSEHWYKLIIVCDENNSILRPKDIKATNITTWNELIEGYSKNSEFEYDPPTDNSDELKNFMNITSSSNITTSFNQLNLVSSVSAFIKSFPLNNELSSDDIITRVKDSFSIVNSNIQIWPKLLSVLLLGGSAQFIESSKLTLDDLEGTTLLVTDPKGLSDISKKINPNKSSSIKLSLTTALLSEGIFTKLGKSNPRQIKNLRSIYLSEELTQESSILSFTANIPQLSKGQLGSKFSSTQLNYFRATFGSRLVVELYCPYIVLGPIAQTNFFDYRILPNTVDDRVTCLGSLTTSLEGKMIETENNETLDIEKRQGMLSIRGFTIGKPVGEKRLSDAAKLSDDIAGGEGWLPLVGVFGLWGQDGCLYLYN